MPIQKGFRGKLPRLKADKSDLFEGMIRQFYQRYSQNFSEYIELVGKKGFTAYCEELGFTPNYVMMFRYREKQISRLSVDHVLQVAYITKLPYYTWLCADIKYLIERGIIMLRGIEFEINSDYMCDGVFFYNKYFDRAIGQGSPKIQKDMDEVNGFKNWKYAPEYG